MTAFLIILGSLVVVGLPLYLHYRLTGGRDAASPGDENPSASTAAAETSAGAAGGEVCCGAHAICEKGLPPASPVYFDDEELDRFAGRAADSYTAPETDEFREVMLTLMPQDLVPWTQSIEMRGLELPEPLRDELMMLIADTGGN